MSLTARERLLATFGRPAEMNERKAPTGLPFFDFLCWEHGKTWPIIEVVSAPAGRREAAFPIVSAG
jgi:hypothetical protein